MPILLSFPLFVAFPVLLVVLDQMRNQSLPLLSTNIHLPDLNI